MQDRKAPDLQNLLQRTVGPYIRVITHRSSNVSFRSRAEEVADREGEKVPLAEVACTVTAIRPGSW
jgi:hypothetical protein